MLSVYHLLKGRVKNTTRTKRPTFTRPHSADDVFTVADIYLRVCVCVCVPAEWGAPKPSTMGGVYFPASTQTPWNNSRSLCVSISVCLCVRWGQTVVCPVNPTMRSTPLEALCANETFPYRKRIPPAFCTRPNQYSSCKTYFTEMAVLQQVKAGKERDLSVTHRYLWLSWCEGILTILQEGMCSFYFVFQRKFSCTSRTKCIRSCWQIITGV